MKQEISYELIKYIKENPENAENQEDLLNWACEKFNINDDDIICDIILKIKKLQADLEN